ncbi:hypothetical protein PybrP1_001635 [[Pythium] brassicae (nom. inval.)]|nr:hypothetical protein PybrP1_001635 [[Pythium] brassicae (nom. inval.)]
MATLPRLALVLALAFACALLPSAASSHAQLRRLATDDTAACTAAAASSPFASYLTAIPEAGGLRTCAAANVNDLVTALSAPGSKCQLTTLISLFTSASDPDVAAFMEFLNALFAGLSTSSASASTSGAAAAAPTAASVLASWSTNATKTQGFCNAMNSKVGPCAEALIPALLGILRKGPKCCGALAQYADVLTLITPAGKSAEQALFDLINGLHRTMCTVAGDDTLCGQGLLHYLASVASTSGAKSLLTALVFDGGLPLYVLPDTGTCAALDATSIPSRLVSGASIPYFASSCCAAGLAALLEAVDRSLARLTGNTVPETLNLIAARQAAAKATQFQAFYSAIPKCAFKQSCSGPAFVLPSSFGTAPAESRAGLAAKTAQPKGVACTRVDVCDADKVCSSVCQPGSARIAPWAARALAFQRNQSYDKSLCYTQLPGTHNSATTLARGYGNRDQLFNKLLNASNPNSFMRTNNHFLSLEDQLRIGARFLEIDVHYFGGALHSGHCSRVSFSLIDDASAALVAGLTSLLAGGDSAAATSSAVTVEWDASLFGCLPSLSGIRAEEQRLQRDSLAEVAAWLTRNPRELVVLYSEVGTEVAKFAKLPALLQLYTEAFGDLLFTPADLKAKGGSWDEFTLSELIGDGKRVILVTTPTANELMFQLTKLCAGWADIPGGAKAAGATSLWGQKYNKGSLVRAYQSALRYATLSENDLKGGGAVAAANASASDPTDVAPATLPTFVNAGVNFLAPDGLDGAAMEAMVWSWAPKEPSAGDTAAEVSAADGRWYGVADKAAIKNVACVGASDRAAWKVVAQGAACPSGFVAGAPHLAIENAALVAALRATGASATAQLALDLSTFPAISAADEKEFESASAASPSAGGSSGSSTPLPGSAASSSGAAVGALWLSALLSLWFSVDRV